MFKGKILDPIHGSINLTEIEKWVIQQKIFHRLRKVKQNTLLNYVFPGANHTRFEHSIGVMHLANEIYNKSNENVEIAKYKSKSYSKHILSVLELDKDNKDVVLQEVRLAALLHDVGHGPTSHKFDDFTITGNQLLKILETDNIFKEYLEKFRHYLNRSSLDDKIEHEIVSCVFIIKILTELKSQESLKSEYIPKIKIDNIIKMIEPNFDPTYEIKLGGKIVTDYFNSIIASFPIDADRMDYLYRDSFYSGVKYGVYDISRVLMSLVPVEFEGRITMGIKSSGLDSVIRFIQSRNHLYNQVYFHKTNTSTNTMLDFVFRNLTGKSVMDDVKEFKEFENFYWENSDEYFFTVTLKNKLDNNGCGGCGDGNCVENEVRTELLERKLWKRIFEKRETLEDKDYFEKSKFSSEKLEKIQQKLEEKGIYINVYYCNNQGLKGVGKSKIVILDKQNKYNVTKEWKSFNKELEFLDKTNTFITRIYLRKHKHEDDFEEIKKYVLKMFKDDNLIADDNF